MIKFLSAAIIAVAAIAPASVSFAANHGNSPGMHPAGSKPNAVAVNSNGVNSADRDKGIDRAADRRGEATRNVAEANLNSNGIKSLDRDKGLDRAADRRNRHGGTRKHGKKHHPRNS